MRQDYQILQGHSLEVLKTLPDESVQCCITSPPYWSLRDYGLPNQIGWEDTPEEFTNALADVFDEVRRVLKKDGVLWLNLGDSYISAKSDYMPPQTIANGNNRDYITKESGVGYPPNRRRFPELYKPKDLVGIPWMVAFELRKRGWWLRSDVIWSKGSCMPESVQDRCTRSHEYIFLLSKSQTYYYDADAIKEPTLTFDNNVRDRDESKLNNTPGKTKSGGLLTNDYEWKNKRSVWEVNTRPFNDAHFATFPEKLVEPMVLSGSREGDTVLDPFSGAATTGLVALKNHRHYIGCELNADYIEIAERRLAEVQTGLF